MPSRKENPVRVPTELVEYLDYVKDKLAKLTGIESKNWNRRKASKAVKMLASRGTITKQEAMNIYNE